MRKDPVTAEVAALVLRRDRGMCLAPLLDLSQSGTCSGHLTFDHVRDQAMMGKRAPSDLAHLVTLCWFHHLGSRAGANWATSHRDALRTYLRYVR